MKLFIFAGAVGIVFLLSIPMLDPRATLAIPLTLCVYVTGAALQRFAKRS